MKRFLLNLLCITLPVILFGQKTFQYHLEWSELLSQRTDRGSLIYYYTFQNAVNLYDFGALPLQETELDLPSKYFTYEAEIKVISADTLSNANSKLLADADLISSSPQFRIIDQDNFSSVYVLPFLKTKNGDVVRIDDFELLLDLVPALNPSQNEKVAHVQYTNESVLNTGTWFKMGITKTGIHKVSYNDLVNIGIDPSKLDPDKIGIFGNYDGMLPEENSKSRQDDLLENDIEIVGGDDGKFDESDYILFYAQSATTWWYNIFSGRFEHFTNLYADTVYYFLTTDQGTGKRIQSIASSVSEPTEVVNSFYDFAEHENDLENLIKSGKEFYGERFVGDTNERKFSFDFPNLDHERPVYLNFEMVARGLINTYAKVYVNDQLVIDSAKFNRISTNGSKYASEVSQDATFFTDNDKLDVTVKYYADDPTAIGWLNFLELNVERNMIFPGGQMSIRNPHVTASGNITRFDIEQVKEPVRLWDISYPFKPLAVEYKLSNNKLEFVLPTDTLRTFILFDNTQYLTPVNFIPVANQNLHGISDVNFVIISPDKFADQAERLAQIHYQVDGLKSVVVSPDQVYNEFSSGSQDISAIRDFMRMLRKKGAFGESPAYLLLFGDASFDYKNRIPDNVNLIPTYESDVSLIETQSYATDDYFGLLDDDEGRFCRGNLDIGIGRFPVSNHDDAVIAVDKVEHYLQRNDKLMRPWRNNIGFFADDGDNNTHLKQAEYLISTIDTVQPNFNLNKVFFDAFTKVIVPGGKRYPDVNERIKKQVEDGALIVNYTGHGGLIGWSEEMVLDVPTIRAFDNYDNMPLFITATCEFSRFDNPEFVSAGEYLFLNAHGGGIALLTTTRLAYATANIIVNQRIYKKLMQREDGDRPRLGDMIRMSKIPSSSSFLNFVLLGDPALRLSFPQYNVVTNKINDKAAGNNQADTVHALSLVTINGSIDDNSGNKLDNFNGYIYPKVFDKPSEYMTLGNDGSSYPETFSLMDKILFNGKVSVENGDFSFSFLVPKDINYKYGFGKISYYALDTSAYVDAWGSYQQLYIGGLDDQYLPDNTGPEIVLYMNDKDFNNGGVVPQNSYFYANLFDESGVYSTGISLGRDITLTMDGDLSNTMIMNEYYTLDLNSYKSGKIAYLFDNLPDGMHSITLKAWDLQNNSSEATVDFYVDKNAEIMLSNVINSPNPFTDETYFGFIHNKNGSILNVQINIFDINGRFVKQLNESVGSTGNKIQPIKWDGTNQNGYSLPAGLYTYNIIVTDYTGKKTIQSQKLIKLSD